MDTPNIITITFNPCVDKSTTIPSLVPEKKLRCSPPVFEPGGGGINVARALRKLGESSTAIYPSGGYSGNFLNSLLQEEQISTITIDIKNHTRENMIALDLATNLQYRFGMPGSELYEAEWKACLKAIEESKATFIVASGSLPTGVPVDIFARIATMAKKQNRKLIIDSSGPALELALREGVFLAKPNLGELSKLAGKEEINPNEIEPFARELIMKGACEILVVSMGMAGALLISKEKVYKVTAPAVKIKSTVGAGDSMVAGMVKMLALGKNLKEVLQYGIACGTAATMNSGTQLCNKEDVENLFTTIQSAG